MGWMSLELLYLQQENKEIEYKLNRYKYIMHKLTIIYRTHQLNRIT